MTIGKRIRARRNALKMTQADLARLVSVVPSAIVQWEHKDPAQVTVPRAKYHARLAVALKTTVDWLLTGNGDLDPDSPNSPLAISRFARTVGVAGAGVWREPGAKMTGLPDKIAAFPGHPYPGAEQYSLTIQGDDLARSRPGANWLYVVSIKETGHALEPGNVVVVEHVDGQRVENSIWTVIRNGVGLALASESALRADRSPISVAQIDKDPDTSIKYLAIGFAGRM